MGMGLGFGRPDAEASGAAHALGIIAILWTPVAISRRKSRGVYAGRAVRQYGLFFRRSMRCAVCDAELPGPFFPGALVICACGAENAIPHRPGGHEAASAMAAAGPYRAAEVARAELVAPPTSCP